MELVEEDDLSLRIPEDLFPQLIRQSDFITFVKWIMVNKKWRSDAFAAIHAIDSFLALRPDQQTSLATNSNLVSALSIFLLKHYAKFTNVKFASLACRWWWMPRSIASQARTDIEWVPTLFPIVSLNLKHLVRLEVADYDGMSEPGAINLDPLDQILSSMGPYLKQLCLMNVWITETTVSSIASMPSRLQLLNLEGSSFPDRVRSDLRQELIVRLFSAPAVRSVESIRLTWSISTTIMKTGLPGKDIFPNVRFLDLGTGYFVTSDNPEPVTYDQWCNALNKIGRDFLGLEPTALLSKSNDLLCLAVQHEAFSEKILDLFISEGFSPAHYADLDYFEADSRRMMRTHPVVAALEEGFVATARLLIARGFLSSNLDFGAKMRFLFNLDQKEHQLLQRPGTDPLAILNWIASQPEDIYRKLFPTGRAGFPLFIARGPAVTNFDRTLAQFLVDESHAQLVANLGVDLDLPLASGKGSAGPRTIRSIAQTANINDNNSLAKK